MSEITYMMGSVAIPMSLGVVGKLVGVEKSISICECL
jgi:hypothetical protein